MDPSQTQTEPGNRLGSTCQFAAGRPPFLFPVDSAVSREGPLLLLSPSAASKLVMASKVGSLSVQVSHVVVEHQGCRAGECVVGPLHDALSQVSPSPQWEQPGTGSRQPQSLSPRPMLAWAVIMQSLSALGSYEKEDIISDIIVE